MTASAFPCRLCGGKTLPTGAVCCDAPERAVVACSCCGLRQVGDIGHVRTDHYAADFYFPEDFGPNLAREETWNLKRIRMLSELLPDADRRRILDFGCGVGGFLRRAQGRFGSVVGFDLSERVCAEHRKLGFPCCNSLDDVPSGIDTIVLFHVLEHVVRPWDLLAELADRFAAVDRIVVEVPNTDEALNALFANEAYGRNHHSADHIYYFTNHTLRLVVEKAGLEVLVDTQMQRYTLGNTLGWLARHAPGGQNRWPGFNEAALNDCYEQALVSMGAADSVFLVCGRRGAP